jgi:putative oxidoreductase
MPLDEIRTTWSPRILSVLRIMAALLLLQYGMAKLLGFPPVPYLNDLPRFSLFWTAGLFEFFGGLLLLIGLFTRCAAFVLSGLMACAYFIYHMPKGFYPIVNGGDLAILFCFVFLYFAFAGGGAWSVDAVVRRKS